MKRRLPPADVVAARDVVDNLLPLFTRTRLDRNLSLRAAALQVGCGAATLSEWQTGKIEPSLRIVRSILAWMVGEQPAAPPADIGDELSGASFALLQTLIRFHGIGQTWLLLAPGGYGLVVPQVDGTHHYVRTCRRSTVRALETAGLAHVAGAVEPLPRISTAAGLPQWPIGHRINLLRKALDDVPPVELPQDVPILGAPLSVGPGAGRPGSAAAPAPVQADADRHQ